MDVIIAVVIPAVFNSFGMEPAGRFLRRVFDRYSVINMGIVVLLGILASMRHRAYGRHSSRIFSVSSAEWSLVAAMALVTFTILVVLGNSRTTGTGVRGCFSRGKRGGI